MTPSLKNHPDTVDVPARQGVLPYAPATRRSVPARIRRIAITLVFASLVVAAWHYAKPYLDQTRYLQMQDRFRAIALPADLIAFEYGSGSAQLLSDRGRYRPPTSPLYASAWTPNPPPDWMPPAHYFLPEFDQWSAPLPSERQDALLFSHERKSGRDSLRIVSVTLGCAEFGPEGFGVVVRAKTWIPATRRVGSRISRESITSLYVPLDFTSHNKIRNDQALKVFAAQPDPLDPAKFSARFVFLDRQWQINGQLRDAGSAPPGKRPYDTPWIELGVVRVSETRSPK